VGGIIVPIHKIKPKRARSKKGYQTTEDNSSRGTQNFCSKTNPSPPESTTQAYINNAMQPAKSTREKENTETKKYKTIVALFPQPEKAIEKSQVKKKKNTQKKYLKSNGKK